MDGRDQFIVWDRDYGCYVASIDTTDGYVDTTADRRHARIFAGATWRDHWAGERYRLEPYPAEGGE